MRGTHFMINKILNILCKKQIKKKLFFAKLDLFFQLLLSHSHLKYMITNTVSFPEKCIEIEFILNYN